MALPETYRGTLVKVAELDAAGRRKHGLSTHETIRELGATGPILPSDLDEMLDYVQTIDICGFDTETSGLDPFLSQIILVQVGDRNRQYLIWWQQMTPEAKERFRLEFYQNPDIPKAGFNLKFDLCQFGAQEGLDWWIERPVDCQLLEQILHRGLTGNIGSTLYLTGLGKTAERWLGLEMVKDEETRTGWELLTPGVWSGATEEQTAKLQAKRLYAADDVCIPPTIAMIQNEWLAELELAEPVKLEMDFLPELSAMEVRGVGFDFEKWKIVAKESEIELAKAEAELDELFDVTTMYTVDMDDNITVTRDKNYASSTTLRDLVHNWVWENMAVDVIMTNEQLKNALIRTGMKAEFAEKLFEKKRVPNPEDPTKQMNVGYPGMVDYLTGSDHVPNRWDKYYERLSDHAFVIPDTDSDTLRLMRILHEADNDLIDPSMPTMVGLPPRLVDPILRFREYSTKVSRYGMSWEHLIHPVTGRLHTNTTQTAADTTRLTTRPNLQNCDNSAKFRDCFIAGEVKGVRFKYVIADFSQIEPRIIAQASKSKAYMRIFWSDRIGSEGWKYWCGKDVQEALDLYGAIGAEIGVLPKDAERKSVAKLPENKAGRSQSKIAVLGLGYGTGKDKFHIQYMLDMGVYVPRWKSDELFDGFWAVAEDVKAYLDSQSDLADPRKSQRKVYHPFLRKKVTYGLSLGGTKRFFDPESPRWWTQGRNFPVQACGAEILKRTVIELGKKYRENGWEGGPVLTAHDEILTLATEEDAPIVATTMEKVMARAGNRYCPQVPITAEAEICDYWQKG